VSATESDEFSNQISVNGTNKATGLVAGAVFRFARLRELEDRRDQFNGHTHEAIAMHVHEHVVILVHVLMTGHLCQRDDVGERAR
jgi:hypothetical protein